MLHRAFDVFDEYYHFVQVVMRYVFHSSLTWSEEMARYLFVWLVYFSVAYTAKK